MSRFLMCLILTLVLCNSSAGWSKKLSDADRVQVESLHEEGMALLEKNELEPAATYFQSAIAIDEKYAPSYVGLGHVYLKQRDLKAAEKAFLDARRKKHDYAPAYNGLGLVWRELPNGLYKAIEYFRKALQYDRDYIEARFHIAEARYAMEEYDVKKEAEKLIEMDATFAPAYRLLGEWHETFKGDHEKAEKYYQHYLSLEPENLDVMRRLAGVYHQTGAHAKIVELLSSQIQAYPDSIETLPLLAIAYINLDSLDRAETLFHEYLEHCDPKERTLYEDIRLLSSPDEYKEYQQTSDREIFLNRFWGDRDPDLTTPANERKLEHYRRVLFARQNFSKAKQPWDTRGEVYVRFGEPDHRSQSDWQNFQQSAAVQRVKETLAIQIFGAGFASQIATVYVAFPVRSVQKDFGNFKAPTHEPIVTYINRDIDNSMDNSMVPWESWVYVNNSVGGGMEVTFTDELQNGKFDYAPPPMDVDYNIRQLAAFNRMSPRNVTMRATARFPNYYQTPTNEDPFEFYYDLADFRGSSDSTSTLEVYTGIPQTMAAYMETADSTELNIEHTVGVLNKDTGEAYRVQDDIRFHQPGNVTQEPGAFIPDVVRLNLPPAHYRLEVKVRDKRTGRRGRYRQTIQVEAYPETNLQISDLELAWQIKENRREDKFSKGALHVIPIPTRTYGKGQSVYVYYEIYNLRRNEFGQTRYQVSYTVGQKNNLSVSNIARLIRIQGDRQQEIAVAYEQQGTSSTEVEYVALDLSEYKEGRQTLQVEVTDLNSGETVQKGAVFVIK